MLSSSWRAGVRLIASKAEASGGALKRVRLETPDFPSHDSEEVGKRDIIKLLLGAPRQLEVLRALAIRRGGSKLG